MIVHLEPAQLLKLVVLLEMVNLDVAHMFLPLVVLTINIVVQMDTLAI